MFACHADMKPFHDELISFVMAYLSVSVKRVSLTLRGLIGLALQPANNCREFKISVSDCIVYGWHVVFLVPAGMLHHKNWMRLRL